MNNRLLGVRIGLSASYKPLCISAHHLGLHNFQNISGVFLNINYVITLTHISQELLKSPLQILWSLGTTAIHTKKTAYENLELLKNRY